MRSRRRSMRSMRGDVPRRVLMTADTVGGVWTHALALIAALGERGVRVALATMGTPPSVAQCAALARIPTATLFASGCKLEWMSEPWEDVDAAGNWLLALEREWRPDVVHLNQFAFGALPFASPKVVVAHSCVLSWWRAVHGEPAPAAWDRYRDAVTRGLAGADMVAAPTRAMLASVREHYGYAADAMVIANAGDACAFVPGPKAPRVLAAGRLWDAAKNLAALEAVAPALPWPVRVAGSFRHPEGGERVSRNVQGLGELEPRALAAELAQASIYALPARYEPFGLSALEAALAGCALVLGDIASLREVWGDAALYVAPDDHGALQATLLRLIGDAALRQRLARAARARALRLSPARMADRYVDAYRHAARARQAAARAASDREHACAS